MATPESHTTSTARTQFNCDEVARPSGAAAAPAAGATGVLPGTAAGWSAASWLAGVDAIEPDPVSAATTAPSVIARHAWSAVTAGIVSISDRPMVATT